MTSESAEILARALEHDADTQEKNKTSEIGNRYDDVYSQILPINEIPEDLFGLAMRFWDDWVDASNHEWKYHEPLVESDWPRIARTIAAHLRDGTLPRDELILEQFLPKPKKPMLQRIKNLFSN